MWHVWWNLKPLAFAHLHNIHRKRKQNADITKSILLDQVNAHLLVQCRFLCLQAALIQLRDDLCQPLFIMVEFIENVKAKVFQETCAVFRDFIEDGWCEFLDVCDDLV